jgi:hypothetical protein
VSGLHSDCNRSLRWRHVYPDANGNGYSFGIGNTNCHGYGNSDRYSQTYAYTTVIADA